ncbi:unnamed protein product (macronuclear) [Paramecium tetraurelia]|uniref:Uncharacterized protein n=1 Tax=Paramecium tetraurelia TaxID=5888 RepID=A0BSX7_PARTE|nr:uncharacterized protein GSPATT00031876001 [Paramecium tetraurelia]CAK61644.1 unnamed protein product [Paramecium tetraurelia]|eukprot:XP_001429042.1 hypothetical protein (macronuclear) [Paramecium tetraurelia strain d4-2]
MLSYQNVAQNEYQKEKTIPSPNPLSRPKDNNTNQQPTPVPQPFNTLLPTNLLHPQTIENDKQSQVFPSHLELNPTQPLRNNHISQITISTKSIPKSRHFWKSNNHSGKRVKTQSNAIILPRSQLRKLQNENSQLKKVIDQLQSELQSVKNQKSIEQDLKAKFDYQEEMILKLKSEVRRKQEALQENQYKLGDLDRIQKKLEDYNFLTSKQNELNKQIKDLQDQVSDQKRQLVYLNSVEHENTNLKGFIETYKQQLREKDLKIEQQREQQEQLYTDNKKMKATLDMLNFELKKQQENSKDQSHRATIQITELQGQVNSLQKSLANQTHQFELQKQQVKQLENKEKELYSTKNQNLFKIQTNRIYYVTYCSIIQLEQQDIEKLSMTLKNGKQEFLNQQQKLANAELEIKKQSDQLQQLQKYKDQLVHQCQFLDQELKKKQGNLDQSIALAQHKQIEMKTIQDQQQNQLQFLEGELQKRDSIIFTLDQQNLALKSQLEQYSQADSVNKNELNSNFAKMREMHNDLILYEKQVNSLNMENHQIKLQSQMLQDRNNQLEFEVTKLREQSIQQDNRVRNLENELHSQSFNQKLNTVRMPYTSDQLFPNQQQFSSSNIPMGSFNQQFNLYK